MTAALVETGGSGVVRSADGPFDAATGQALTSFDDLAGPPTGLHPQFLALPAPDHTVITYDVYATLWADSQTRVGRTAEAWPTSSRESKNVTIFPAAHFERR